MGKGDKRSRRGKINAGSWGVYRPRKSKGAYVLSDEDKLKKAAKEVKEKKTAKRKAPKKADPVVEEVKVEAVVEEAPVEAAVEEVKVEAAPAEEVKAEEKPAEEPKKEKKAAKKSSGGDDLKKIEGIGPATMKLFNAAGIESFSDLAGTSVDKLKEILAEAGSRYKLLVPDTWPEQAGLAAEDKWDELKELQDKLDGGKRVD
ncbi:MAG: 30S ribosomal protein THX [Pseudomonadota bacterium]